MTFRTIFGAAAACLTFTGAAYANVNYACGAVNGIEFTAILFDEEDVVAVDARNQSTGQVSRTILGSAVSGSGARYFDPSSGLDFVEHQGQAFLTTLSGAQFNCIVTSVTEPGGNAAVPGNPPQGGGTFAGFSFGGNLRAGPGTNFADVGSTFNGQQLTLIADTGVVFNGFNWWVVQLPNGQQAHQWGGLLCAPRFVLNGIFNDGC